MRSNVCFFLFTVIDGIFVGRGVGTNALGAVILSTACNIFGDWLLIFPIPLGTKGAALATGLSQTVAFLVMATHLIRRQGVLAWAGSGWRAGRSGTSLCMVCPRVLDNSPPPL